MSLSTLELKNPSMKYSPPLTVANLGIPIITTCSRVGIPWYEIDCSCLGPGSILGWSLIVMGCELPSTMEEEREYVRCRWAGLHGLGIKHSFNAAELLEVHAHDQWY